MSIVVVIKQGFKNTTLLVYLCLCSLFFMSCFIGYALSLDNTFFVITTVLFFFGIFGFIFLSDSFFFVFLFPFFLAQTTLVISVAYLDFGAYAPEIKEFTDVGYSVFRLVVLDLFFVLCVALSLLFMSKVGLFRLVLNYRAMNRNAVTLIKTIIYILAALLIVYGVFFGFPVFEGEQRFDYWSRVALGGLLSKVLYLTSAFGLFLGFFSVAYPHKKLEVVFMALILSVVAALYSNKFSWFLSFITFYIIGAGFWYYLFDENKSFRIWVFKVLFLFVMIVSPIVLYGYVFLHGYVGDELIYILENRVLTMQGQVWWFVDNYVQNTSFDSNISDVFIRYPDYQPSGIFKMMELIMPENAFINYFEKKIPLTMGFPAIFIYSSGYLGAVFLIPFFALIYAFVYFYSFLTLLRLSIYRVGVVVLMLSILPWGLSLGSTYVIFTPFFLTLLMMSLLDVFLLSKACSTKNIIKDS